MVLLAAVLGAYLLGAIPFGYLTGRLTKGVDIRRFGSGATGGTNTLRVLGWGPALVTAALDVGKGTVAVLIGAALDRVYPSPLGLTGPGWYAALTGLAAVVGHCWPVYLGFKGGKGVAAGGGTMLALRPLYLLIALPVLVLTVALTRYVSLGSVLATLSVVVLTLLDSSPISYKAWVLGTAAIVIYRHNANIKRLLSGTENRFGQRVEPK